MRHHRLNPSHAEPAIAAGLQVRHWRQQAGLSQLDLALIAGVSQRHLSCVETGRAKASPSTLHALLSALDIPLEHCNAVFLAAGYAPRYAATPLDAPDMAVIHAALEQILLASNPAPAIVIDSQWNIVAANVSTGLLLTMAGVPAGLPAGLNLLDTLLRPGGLGDRLANAQEVRTVTWQRACREAASNRALAQRLQGIAAPALAVPAAPASPVLLTRMSTPEGELRFLSTFTTFGMPADITVASLRIEHLVPADAQTQAKMTAAYAQWNAAA
ncbi:helix-turn-helix domain-containing protein [Pseudomonas sp. RP23018S]|uniref:helix-turn-helix domain-containing protein n=1 Tax=Pseudomonas sp. RP23018S TaxID=3096037 RepID=UPI002ACA165E|nr:helix-turn-helix domain-containing protein [Pseudomonas sp. RP23018S]MDZ5602722.1 helix-turn-helix domain-containing protein [Pseudomonas sp. RP23018S]